VDPYLDETEGHTKLAHPRTAEGEAMKRGSMVILVLAIALAFVASIGGRSHAKVFGPNGQIAFTRQDPTLCSKGCTSIYTVDPDGTNTRKLVLPGGNGIPHWSPDGTEISMLADCSFGGPCSAAIVDADTEAVRYLPNPDPALYNEFFACLAWSPDGATLGCDVVSDTPGMTGIYTIRSSDGGDLTRVLSCPGECGPSDFSPDGRRIVTGLFPDGDDQAELFTVRVDGTGLRQITPNGTIVDLGDGEVSWSPNGHHLLFGGRTDADHARSIFVVNADGTGLHQIPIPGCGTLRSEPRLIACFDPGWSPDGAKIVFARAKANPSTILGKPSELNSYAIYTVNPDGNALTQVTTTTNLEVFGPDWGTHPRT
jgi:Tol biopolymer transport system component